MSSARLRTLNLRLASEPHTVKGYTETQWQVAALEPGNGGPHELDLQLYMTEK